MSLLPLRPYQRDAVDAVRTAIAGGMRRPAVVLPTGAGKTVVFAHLGTEWLADNPGQRILVLAHTGELLDQAMAKWGSVAPGMRIGRVQADANETLARVVVASVQTLRFEARRRMLRDVGLIIVDECHHAVAATYRAILDHFEDAVAVGFTATMMRGDDLALGSVWQDVVYERGITEMIAEGHLVRPRGVHVHVDDLDLSVVRTTRGDYREGELGQALENSLAPEAIVKAVAEHADQRKILLFAPTVSSARVIGDALSDAGRAVGLVHGEMGKAERRGALDAFRAGETQILANCQLLTEGFDEPAADCAVIARPTRSPVLYRQIAGRVLRPSPGKLDALLLDVVGASKVHSLITGVSLFGDDPTKAVTENDQADEALLEDPDELDSGQQDARQALGLADGRLISTEVDLFAGSVMAWLRTRAGVFFLAAGERYIAILPAAPKGEAQWLAHFHGARSFLGYDVIAMDKSGHAQRSIVQGVADLSYAMAWAEGDVTLAEQMTARRERAWRARPPSEKMLAFAARLRVYVPPGARQGEVSNMITLALASNRIDPSVPAYARSGAR